MSIETIIEKETRLAILKGLAGQHSKTLTSEATRRMLFDELLIEKSRDWVELQFVYLEEVRMITLHKAASVQIAKLSERGEQFLAGLVHVSGIQPPGSRH